MRISITDPICWMDVDINSIASKSEYKGRVYFFCSMECKRAFDEEPDEYIDESISTSQELMMSKNTKSNLPAYLKLMPY